MPKEFPVTLRFEEMFPNAAARMLMHAKRSGGPLDHVEMAFVDRNRIYVGEDFAADVKAEILEMMHKNRDEEVAALIQNKRPKQARDRAELGLVDPWKASENGPLREAVLTANKDFFLALPGTPDHEVMLTYGTDRLGNSVVNRLSKAKIEEFAEAGHEYFNTRFPGAIRHLRLDLDEEAPHFHALIVQRTEKTSGRRGKQLLIQPTSHPLLKSYEMAQDDAGEFFSSIGLVRGERTAKARREAREQGASAPAPTRNVSPREHREARARYIAEAEQEIEERSRELDRREVDAFLDEMAVGSASVLARHHEVEADLKIAEANERIAEADATSERAQQEMASAEKFGEALKTGVKAVEDRELDYRPATEKEAEGLAFGPAAPNDKTWRKRLAEAVRPAYDHIVGFARSLFHLRKKEAALERKAAENARRARVIALAEAAAGRQAAHDLAAIAKGGEPLPYSEASFPGAWAIRADAQKEEVQAKLDAMTNLTLRDRYQASRDAVLLCDETPSLKALFTRGMRALQIGAAQRGFDLETGRHDPSRASDPERARLHTDRQPKGISVKSTDGARQLKRE